MAEPNVDQTARSEVADVRHELANHKMVTEIKLDGLMRIVAELKSQLKWAGVLIVTLFLSTLTWSLTQQYNANEAQKKDMQQQLDILRAQERARNASRAEILSRLPPGTAEASDAAGGVAQGGNLGADGARNGAQN